MAARRVVPVVLAAILCSALQASGVRAADIGHVHLVAQIVGPVLSDHNALLYEFRLRNVGPDTATGLQTTRNTLICQHVTDPLSACENTPPSVRVMRRLAPGEENIWLSVAQTDQAAETARTTFQVSHLNEQDDFSVPGSCNYGQKPQPACATQVTQLPH